MGQIKKKLCQILDKLGCHHEWEHIGTVNVESDFSGTYSIYHFVCKKCGKFKKVKSY
jgi:hypothetical protein